MSPADVKGAQVTEDTGGRDGAACTRIDVPRDAGFIYGSVNSLGDGSGVRRTSASRRRLPLRSLTD